MSKAIESKVKDWLKVHTSGVSHKLRLEESGEKLISLPGHFGSNLNLDLKTSDGSRWHMNIGFDPPLTSTSSTQQAQTSFSWIALDRIPIPGLETPDNWEVYPQTPVSSFKEGVEVISFDGTRLAMKVKTSAFCIYGRQTDISVPGCGPSPPGSYFQVRESIPIHLELDLPVSWVDSPLD